MLLVEVEGMVGLVAMMDHHRALCVHFLLEDFQRIAGVQSAVVGVDLIMNVVAGMMRDQTFEGEVPATLHLHNSLRDTLLS